MTLTHLEDDYDHFYSPRFEVQVGPRTYREADGRISGLTVDTGVEKTNTAEFTLNERYDHEHGSFVDFAENPVIAGMPVVVRLGYGDTLRPMFVGTVSSVQPDFPSSGGPTLGVRADDLAHEMTKGARSRSWSNTTVSAVVADVVAGYPFRGVSVDLAGALDLTFQSVIQEGVSDYAFLRDQLADRLGYEFFVKGGVFHFRKPNPLAAPVVTLEYGKSLQSFRPNEEDANQSVGSVEVRAWDPGKKDAVTATATVPEGGDETDVRRAVVESQREAQRIADAAGYDLAPTTSGRCETIGLPEIREGEVVVLEGLGRGFTGPYYVTSTTHRVDDSGYTTSFEASRAELFEGIL
ncbi:phage late control D family protein [Halosimplex amylolyticum]|uniref:phage late control D family protein n=1 Tax=Halosimplex amylolyticum TaxID=3396616 RepID=UPI003F548D7E